MAITARETRRVHGYGSDGYGYGSDVRYPFETQTRRRGYGFHTGAGTGRGRVTRGLPVTCTIYEEEMEGRKLLFQGRKQGNIASC